MLWESASGTDPGRVRRNNEDALLVRDDRGLFAVADGMGGHAAGEVASGLAVETLGARITANSNGLTAADLAAVFETANDAILDRAAAEPSTRGMGTTFTVLVAGPEEGRALVAHIGDSRLYRWRDGQLELLTRDHTWVQEHVDAGVLTTDQARTHPFSSVLTRVLGTTTSIEPDVTSIEVQADDLFLLCSDGLTGMLDDAEIAEILDSDMTLDQKADRLIDTANEFGGADNITLVLARAARAP